MGQRYLDGTKLSMDLSLLLQSSCLYLVEILFSKTFKNYEEYSISGDVNEKNNFWNFIYIIIS